MRNIFKLAHLLSNSLMTFLFASIHAAKSTKVLFAQGTTALKLKLPPQGVGVGGEIEIFQGVGDEKGRVSGMIVASQNVQYTP